MSLKLIHRVNMRSFSIPILLVLLCFTGTLHAQKLKSRKFPVKLKLTAKKPDDSRRQEISLQLTIEKDVSIYSHRVKSDFFQPPRPKFTITTSNGKEIDAKYTYPKGTKIEDEFFGVHPANALVGIEMKDMLISSEVVFNRLQRQEIKHVQEFTEP